MLEYEEMHKNFCTNLKDMRKQMQMTQEDFARFIGIGRTLYTKYETCAATPTFIKLLKIISALNVSADFLFGIKANDNIDK